MKKTINIIIFGLLILIFGSFMFTFQVRQDQVAFLSTGGKPSKPIETTGLKFKLPWPFQQLYKFDKRIHLETNDYEEMTTSAKEDATVVIQFYFGWQIGDAGKFFKSYKGTDDEELLKVARKKIKAEVQRAGKETIKDHYTNVGYFISNNENQDNNQTQEDKGRQSFKETEETILENAAKRLVDHGVKINFVGIRRVGVPQSTLDKVLDAMVTEWVSKAETEKVRADSMAATIRSNAFNQRIAAINTAKIQAASRVSEAQEKAKKQFETFKKDPELAAFLMQLDALERSVKDQTTLILDETMGPFPILRGLKPYLEPGKNESPLKPE